MSFRVERESVGPIIELIKQTIRAIRRPLQAVCETHFHLGGAHMDSDQLILNSLLQTSAYFAKIDGRVVDDEASLLLAVFRGISNLPDVELMAKLRTFVESNRGETVPDALQVIVLLQAYDKANDTSAAHQAKGMYFRLANAICKADGDVSDEETKALAHLSRRLYGSTLDTADRYATSSHVVALNGPPQTELAVATKAELPPVRIDAKDFKKLDELLQELNELIGLERVKTQVGSLVNFLKIQELKRSKGLPVTPTSNHLVFSGSPGTGKTTVARLLAQIYARLGVLSNGQLIETDRGGLVAGYLGQTALKTKEVLRSAIGGVLFIDEAYALAQSAEGDQYGQEAIDTLLKTMEDKRDEIVVVVAGYSAKMRTFIDSNPGLASRFNQYVEFDDYTPEQLTDIFAVISAKAGYSLAPEARQRLLELFTEEFNRRDASFGNGRLARNLFEKSVRRQADRIVALPDVSIETLMTIDVEDVVAA